MTQVVPPPERLGTGRTHCTHSRPHPAAFSCLLTHRPSATSGPSLPPGSSVLKLCPVLLCLMLICLLLFESGLEEELNCVSKHVGSARLALLLKFLGPRHQVERAPLCGSKCRESWEFLLQATFKGWQLRRTGLLGKGLPYARFFPAPAQPQCLYMVETLNYRTAKMRPLLPFPSPCSQPKPSLPRPMSLVAMCPSSLGEARRVSKLKEKKYLKHFLTIKIYFCI